MMICLKSAIGSLMMMMQWKSQLKCLIMMINFNITMGLVPTEAYHNYKISL